MTKNQTVVSIKSSSVRTKSGKVSEILTFDNLPNLQGADNQPIRARLLAAGVVYRGDIKNWVVYKNFAKKDPVAYNNAVAAMKALCDDINAAKVDLTADKPAPKAKAKTKAKAETPKAKTVTLTEDELRTLISEAVAATLAKIQ